MTLLVSLLLAAGPTVAVVDESCDPPLIELVRSELELAGLPSSLVAADAPPLEGELAQVRLKCSAGVVEVRVEDHLTSKRVERQLLRAVEPRGTGRAALQVVELLHASLAEARFLPSTPPQVEVFLERQAPTPPSPWHVSVLGGLAVAPGGFGAQPLVSGAVSRSLAPLELTAQVGATVHSTTLHGIGGTAELGLIDARLRCSRPIELGAATLRPQLGLGALMVWASGRATLGYVSQSGVTGTAAPSLGLSVEGWPTSWLGLTAGAEVAFALVPVVVRFSDGAGAKVGLPLVSLTLGVLFR